MLPTATAWPWGRIGACSIRRGFDRPADAPHRHRLALGADRGLQHPAGASIARLMLPTATPYRARNVGKTVGNKIFSKFFPFIFNSLESKFYSNSGSQIAFQGMSPKGARRPFFLPKLLIML
jgi:hypothetical protein